MNHVPVDFALLQTFIAIAESKSFLTAADRVGRSPSAVSMQIKRLEQLLGASLFIRNAQDTSLTRDGERLVQYARQLLASELEMRNAFRSEPIIGQVTLGVPDDVVERFPMQVIREFGDLYPDVAITITVNHTPSLLEAVRIRAIDLAIVTYAESIPGINKAEVIYQEPEVWAMRKGGIAANRNPLPVVIWKEKWAWYKAVIDILESVKKDYQVVMKSENITARRNAIEADFAVGPLPSSQLGDNLVPVPAMMALPALPVYGLGLIVQEEASPPARVLADFLRTAVNYQSNQKT